MRMTHTRSRLAWQVYAACAFAIVLAASAASAGDPPVTPADVQGPYVWGAATRVTRLGELYFADQPDAAGLRAAHEAGVQWVVDLRAPSELDWDEAAAVEALGMTYRNVPVTGPRFERASFEEVEAIVAEHPDQKILIHCSSSNRAGGWLATHLVTRDGLSEGDALAVGRKAGITKPAIEARVHAYLEGYGSQGATQ
jgi:protein tyrosine phosphatase (PTP) superfamily phosphohydrolase (DUF442 family)